MISETLEYQTERRKGFSSLGIDVDDLSIPETVERIIHLIKEYQHDRRPRLVATLNVDFIVKAVGYMFSRPTHPELPDVLRSADIVTAEGYPIVLLSKIMGAPIRESVAKTDLVPALAERAAQDGLSLFLLGDQTSSATNAAKKLCLRYPSLKIVGITSPTFHADGEGLQEYHHDDAAIVNGINASGADILFIGFGNPKQEQWFHQNRHKLTVPVSIGVGSTFESLAGKVKPAPERVQKINAEWLYRICQSQAKLWQLYVKGICQLAMLTLPIILLRLRELLTPERSKNTKPLAWNTLWGSRSDVVGTVQLPRYVSAATLKNLALDVKRHTRKQRMLILDFSEVYHIEMAAYTSFFELGGLFNNGQILGILLGLRPAVRRRLEAGRLMDTCQSNALEFNKIDLPGTNIPSGEMHCRSYVLNKTALIYLSGHITEQALKQIGFDLCVADMARDRTCIIDLRYAVKIDSTAIFYFHTITKSLAGSLHTIHFSGVNNEVKKIITFNRIGRKLSLISDKVLRRYIFSAKKGA